MSKPIHYEANRICSRSIATTRVGSNEHWVWDNLNLRLIAIDWTRVARDTHVFLSVLIFSV